MRAWLMVSRGRSASGQLWVITTHIHPVHRRLCARNTASLLRSVPRERAERKEGQASTGIRAEAEGDIATAVYHSQQRHVRDGRGQLVDLVSEDLGDYGQPPCIFSFEGWERMGRWHRITMHSRLRHSIISDVTHMRRPKCEKFCYVAAIFFSLPSSEELHGL